MTKRGQQLWGSREGIQPQTPLTFQGKAESQGPGGSRVSSDDKTLRFTSEEEAKPAARDGQAPTGTSSAQALSTSHAPSPPNLPQPEIGARPQPGDLPSSSDLRAGRPT